MELLNTHPIKKSDLGFHGNLFGGKLLAWIDAAAAGYSMQLCDNPRMVTVSIDKCYFEKPAKEGQLLKIYGHPSKLGSFATACCMYCTFYEEPVQKIPLTQSSIKYADYIRRSANQFVLSNHWKTEVLSSKNK